MLDDTITANKSVVMITNTLSHIERKAMLVKYVRKTDRVAMIGSYSKDTNGQTCTSSSKKKHTKHRKDVHQPE